MATEKLTYGSFKLVLSTTVWCHFPYGCLVDTAAACFPGFLRFHRLFHLVRLSPFVQRQLRLLVQRQRSRLHFSVFLAGNFRILTARFVWTQTGLVAGLAGVLSGVFGFVDSG